MKTMKSFCQRLVVAFAMAATTLAAQAGTVTYYHNDLGGSPVVATNASGAVIWRESYRPYGERTVNSAAALDNKVWLTSRRQDPETGLVYMGARYYDPVVGRFVSTDPVLFDEKNLHSFNRYAYGNNNPYRYKDPDGKAAETVFDAISFGISVAMFRNDPTLANFAGAAVDAIAMAVPFVPGGVGAIRAAGNASEVAAKAADTAFSRLKDGDSLPTERDLESAIEHLGAGYKEIAPGVFKSADGNRVVRMTDSELAKAGNHAGAPHLNFETGVTVTKPNGKESFVSKENKHVFLPQEK